MPLFCDTYKRGNEIIDTKELKDNMDIIVQKCVNKSVEEFCKFAQCFGMKLATKS